MFYKNSNHGTADDFQYMTHYLTSFITETTQYDMSCAHFSYRYEERAAHQGRRPDILVHVIVTYDNFQAIFSYLCHKVLEHLFEFPAHIDMLVTYNRKI